MSLAQSYDGSPTLKPALPCGKQIDQLRKSRSRHDRHDSSSLQLWKNKTRLVKGQIAVPQLREWEESNEQPARDYVQNAY